MARYALVIGIEEYDDGNNLSKLTKPVANAEKIAQILNDFGKYNVTLLKGRVTYKEIISSIKSFFDEEDGVAVNQEVVIYFSGHGFLSDRSDELMRYPLEGYLATSDCRLRKNGDKWIAEEKAIKLESIVELIKQTQLSNLVFILDACHSGSLIKEVGKQFKFFENNTDYAILAACQTGERAWAKKKEQYSFFTGALLNAIDQENANDNGYIQLGGVSDRIYDQLRSQQDLQESICWVKGRSFNFLTYPMTNFYVDSSSEDKITSEQIQTLKTILEPIDRSKLAWAIIETIASDVLETWLDEDSSMNLDSFISIINSLPPLADGSPPLLEIIRGLAVQKNVEPSIQKNLKVWLKNFSITEFEVKQYSDINCHLMAVISQKRLKFPFELSAFLKIPNQPQIPIRLRELSNINYVQNPNQPELSSCKNTDDIQNVLGWLKDIVQTTENFYLAGCPHRYKLNIELFLPFDYLQEQVDLWEIKDRGNRKLGQQYRFIVRSLDRFENKDDRNKLVKRWNYIHNNQNLNLLEIIKRLDRENNYDFTQLEYDFLEKEIGFSCNLPDDYGSIFIALLEAGIPLGLWSRPHRCDCEFEQLLHEDINTFEDLIDSVFQKRQNAHRSRSQANSKWGYYLAMLFDNPDRFPRKKYSKTNLKATGT